MSSSTSTARCATSSPACPTTQQQTSCARSCVPAGFEIPDSAVTLRDPPEVFRAMADQGPAEAITAQYLLTNLEVQAAVTALPAPGADDLIRTATRTGRTVTVVTNNPSAAVAAYLERRHLPAEVGRIVGPDEPEPR